MKMKIKYVLINASGLTKPLTVKRTSIDVETPTHAFFE